MNKTAAVKAIIGATTREPIVFTTGYSSRIAQSIADRHNHFYMTGSMGLASSIGIGIARQSARTTLVVEGDGSLLMNPVGLVTAGTLGSLPLVHIVLDDRKYASTGGQDVPSARTDFGALAKACGYRRVFRILDTESLSVALEREIPSCSSTVFLHCVLRDEDPPVPPRIGCDLAVHAKRFRRNLSHSPA